MPDMHHRVIVITGATSGIGLVAAEALSKMGARLVLVARDPTRADAVLRRLGNAAVHYADLSSIPDTKRVAAEIAAAEPRIDVLVNNAGALFNSRRLTADGLELTFATNHMSYFLLTLGLSARLHATPGARVVNTASDAHKGKRLDFDDFQSTRHYRGFSVYGRSKLCNILFTRELAKRWRDTGVTVNCLHPGFVSTRFGDSSGGAFERVVRLAKFFAITPEEGAKTIIHLASSDTVANITGEYFYKCRVAVPTKEAQDDEAAARLWDHTTQLARL